MSRDFPIPAGPTMSTTLPFPPLEMAAAVATSAASSSARPTKLGRAWTPLAGLPPSSLTAKAVTGSYLPLTATGARGRSTKGERSAVWVAAVQSTWPGCAI